MADYEDTKVKDLIINNMSQEKFNELKDAGELDPTQLYCTPKVNALTEPYRLGYATSNGGFYMQLTPLANSDVAIDIMRADGTKAFTAWKMSTDGSAILDGASSGIRLATFNECKYTNQASTLSCTLPNWTYVFETQAYLSFQTTKMPAATSSLAGFAATYIGDTDETFTKGHTYMVESDGAETPTYTWKDVYEVGGAALPDQTGNAGKFLMTDGSELKWGNALENSSANNGVGINSGISASGGFACGYNSTAGNFGFAAPYDAKADNSAIAIGIGSRATSAYAIAIGYNAKAGLHSVAVGESCKMTGQSSIGLGYSGGEITENNVFYAGRFKMLDLSDGTIPTDRYTTTPTTAGTYVPKLTIAGDGTATREWGPESGGAGGDYLPTTGGTLTGALTIDITGEPFTSVPIVKSSNGSGVMSLTTGSEGQTGTGLVVNALRVSTDFTANEIGKAYSKVGMAYITKLNNGADLAVPTEGGTLARLEDLEGLGGLPDQTDNAGKFLMTNGSSLSWATALKNNATDVAEYGTIAIGGGATSEGGGVCIGQGADCRNGISIGCYAYSTGAGSVAIGFGASASADGAIHIGSGTNSEANTFSVGNGNGLFVMMDADGNVPLERLTYVTDQIGDISTALSAILGE